MRKVGVWLCGREVVYARDNVGREVVYEQDSAGARSCGREVVCAR